MGIASGTQDSAMSIEAGGKLKRVRKLRCMAQHDEAEASIEWKCGGPSSRQREGGTVGGLAARLRTKGSRAKPVRPTRVLRSCARERTNQKGQMAFSLVTLPSVYASWRKLAPVDPKRGNINVLARVAARE